MGESGKPIQIVFSETGDVGEITAFGQDLPARKIVITVDAHEETMVQLWVSARHCDIRYEPRLVSDFLDRLESL